jgi:2-amino-4-hydroxy-6-hydroxymethyldihydropteridine diphosphokinase
MARAFISMGSNIDPERNLLEAVRMLAAAVRVLDVSTVHQTEPIGRPEQPSYYNCVAGIETALSPQELKATVLQPIENRLGRVRSLDRYDARTIDLDLILYGELVLREKGFELPDPDILVRPFLAVGLHELAPDLVLPGSSHPIATIVDRLKDPAMKPLETYTALLKGELRHGP